EQTAAFQWLQANAAHYSFELSFPKDNRQGVSYEPWHWRYVGDIQSLKTFYRARQK
ncbi:MAG TPA: D-alanyl-D-alanine carboxypeptidase family protein, partial [Microcoleaceae cyanobacterium]